jgi:hypothetical protein
VRVLFWISAALLAWAQIGYGLFLAALRRLGAPAFTPPPPDGSRPRVSLIVAAYREESVIADKVANALALNWPREALELIVAVDGGGEPDADFTAQRARAAGADVVLELPRMGKYRAQDTAVASATGELLAFSDANALWDRDALAHLAAAFHAQDVGYACGQVRFVNDEGTNQEGLYWRYDMWLRRNESALASVTAGNGAIYAVRPRDYAQLGPGIGHDLAFPFHMVKRGRRAVYVPDARAVEKMVPTLEGEWARKRRMMTHAWPIIVRGGLLDPRGYSPLYALMIGSHRLLRYASPLLHLLVALATLALLPRGRTYVAAAAAQAALVAAALAGGRVRSRPLLVARYYVLTTAALAAGLFDWLRFGTEVGWETPEGTR